MAVQEGRFGKVTVRTTAGNVTIAELNSWNLNGVARGAIDASRFGTDRMKFKHGMLNCGTIQFSGHYDPRDSSGQAKIMSALTSGVSIGNSTAKKIRRLRLWGHSSTTINSTARGYWSCIGSSGEILITNCDISQTHTGLATISFSGQVSDGVMAFSTST